MKMRLDELVTMVMFVCVGLSVVMGGTSPPLPSVRFQFPSSHAPLHSDGVSLHLMMSNCEHDHASDSLSVRIYRSLDDEVVDVSQSSDDGSGQSGKTPSGEGSSSVLIGTYNRDSFACKDECLLEAVSNLVRSTTSLSQSLNPTISVLESTLTLLSNTESPAVTPTLVPHISSPELILHVSPLAPGRHTFFAHLLLHGNVIDIASISVDVVEPDAPKARLCTQYTSVEKSEYADAIMTALVAADSSDHMSLLPDYLFELDGMSGSRFRVFMNTLLRSVPSPPAYLEIGVYKGATFASALHNIEVTAAYAVDNWSLFDGPKDEFLTNAPSITMAFEIDAFAFPEKREYMKDISVYFYDGPHKFMDHYRSVIDYYDILSSTFILIVDDFNFADVEGGTRAALNHVDANIIHETVICTTNNDLRGGGVGGGGWHNGVGIFVISKDPPH